MLDLVLRCLDLGYAIEVIDRINDDDTDEPVLHAVGYLLRAAWRFAQAAPQAA